MTTLVGNQKNFNDALYELIELDYDAIEAYEVAISLLKDQQLKAKLQEFKKDHERHVKELSEVAHKHHVKVPTGPSIGKQWLAKGKVALAKIVGDNAILAAMSDNETDTNTGYSRMESHDGQWEDIKSIIKKGLEDEKRHKVWLQETLKDMK